MALKAMRELPDFEMAPGSPNVLGWQVQDELERPVGNVQDLIVDTETYQVRYLGVRLTNGRSVMIPVGSLDLNLDRGWAKVVDVTREQMTGLPDYQPAALTPEIEARYYVLFHREEPVGAWEPSPPNYELPRFRPRTDRMQQVFGKLRPRARAEGKPGDHVALFAANMPWNISPLTEEGDQIQEPTDKKEPLWQSEQPGVPAALGALRPPTKKPRKGQP